MWGEVAGWGRAVKHALPFNMNGFAQFIRAAFFFEGFDSLS